MDPEGKADRYGIDLNEGLAPGVISPEPKQPLAFNPKLTWAARDHSLWMLSVDEFSHTGEGGTSPGDRMEEAGYQFEPPWSWGENLAWRGSSIAPEDYYGFIFVIDHRVQFIFDNPTFFAGA